MKIETLSSSDLAGVDKWHRLVAAIRSRLSLAKEEDQQNDVDELQDDLDHIEWFIQAKAFDEEMYKGWYQWFRLRYGATNKEYREKINRPKNGNYINHGKDFCDRFVLGMEKRGREKRAKEWQYRIWAETHQAAKDGWFLVFNTLTLDRGSYSSFAARRTSYWGEYIKKFSLLVPGKHSYIAVLENGSRTGRLHLHVLHFLEKLPPGCVDPNRGRARPNRREIEMLRPLWPYGKSAPIAVRFNASDAYAKIGWRWPTAENLTCALDASCPGQVASYMGKYITKTYERKVRKIPWRIKTNQGLGLGPLKRSLKSLKNIQLSRLLQAKGVDTLKHNGTRVPPALLRRLVLRILHQRIGSSWTLKRLFLQVKPSQSIIRRLRSTIPRKQAYRAPSVGVSSNPPQVLLSKLFPNALRLPSLDFYSCLAIAQKLLNPHATSRRILPASSLVR